MSTRYKQTLLFILLLSVSLLLLVGCGGTERKSPSGTVKAFYMAANEGKYSEVEKYFSSDALTLMRSEWAALAGGIKGIMDEGTRNGSIKTVEIIKEEIRGEGATVSGVLHYKDGETEEIDEELIREEGAWKITVPTSDTLGADLDDLEEDIGFFEASPPPPTETDNVLTDLNDRVNTIQMRLDDLEDNFVFFGESLVNRLDSVESKISYTSSPSVKIAYISAEDAFSVFTDAVSDLRQIAVDKQGEITKLQQQYMARTISKSEYDSQYMQLQVELLQAQLNIDIGTIDKMIASSGFSDMWGDLQLLKQEAQPVVDEMKNLVSTVRVGVIDATEFENRYTQLKNAFSQLDQLLTQAATAKIVQAANKIARSEGYDIVLRAKNVIIYRNTAKIEDITEAVKQELSSYL